MKSRSQCAEMKYKKRMAKDRCFFIIKILENINALFYHSVILV